MGYLEALKEAGLPPEDKLLAPVEFEFEPAEAAVEKMLRNGVVFDGIVAASDLLALGALRALRKAGISVPDDVSVVGYDDMLLSRMSTPALTTIRQDTRRAGQLLVSSILDNRGRDLPDFLPTELIIRESCGA